MQPSLSIDSPDTRLEGTNLKGEVLDIKHREEANPKEGKKKSGGRKYSKAAGKTVASAMRRKRRGTLRSVETPTSRKSGEKWGTPSFISFGGRRPMGTQVEAAWEQSDQPQAGDRDRPLRGTQEGGQGPEEEGRVAFDLVGSSRCRITCDRDTQVSHECALVRPGHLYGPGIVEVPPLLKC